MNDKHKTILIELMNNESVFGVDLADKIQMSTRTVRSFIKSINKEIFGAKIESSTLGYKLVVEDYDSFLEYLHQTPEENSVFHQLLLILLNTEEYIKIDDLCNLVFLSRTQVKQSLSEVRDYLGKYNLEIVSKPHYGIKIQGNEENYRKVLTQEIRGSFFKEKEPIHKIIVSCMMNAGYVMSDDTLEDLTNYLYVANQRIKEGKIISVEYSLLNVVLKEKEYTVASSIMTLLNQFLRIPYIKEETAYLTMHLCGKGLQSNAQKYIDKSILNIVEDMLKEIEKDSCIPFSIDLNLQR